jgi:calcineurin-like phosphoesterase family protein
MKALGLDCLIKHLLFQWRLSKVMKLHLMSDLHLEFADYDIPETDADIVVLAGDIGTGLSGMKWAKEQQKKLDKQFIYVAGNHEYYGNNFPALQEKLTEETENNPMINYLENKVCSRIIGDEVVKIIGATLWTNFELFGVENQPGAMILAGGRMNDYQRIRNSNGGYQKLKPADTLFAHHESVRFIEKELQNQRPNEKIVVVTHHLPLEKSVPVEFKENKLSAAYASNLTRLFKQYHIDLWYHAHTHTSCDYVYEDTRVICNPRGYCDENTQFDSKKVIEI